MNYAKKTNFGKSRFRVPGGHLLLVGAASILFNGPSLAADAGRTGNVTPTPTTAAATNDPDTDLTLEQLINVRITTASKSSEKLSEAPAVVSVLTRDELERFGGTTLRDILNRVPGLIGVSGYFTDRSMIGFPGDALVAPTSRHALLLINGRPVREVQEGGIKTAMLEAFPVEAIERIEVIKGPGSVLYGSEAFAGVVNIITAAPEKSGISFTGLGGDDGSRGAMALATVKADDFSLLAAARYFEKADWRTSYALQNGTTFFSVNHTIPDKAVGAYVGANYRRLSLMASFDQYTSSYFIPPFQVVGDAKWRQFFADAGYVLELNERWTMNFNATYNRSWFDIFDGTFPNVARDSHEVLGEWTSFIKPTEKANLVVGFLVGDIKGQEAIIGTPIVVSEGTRMSYGGYVQADYQLRKNVKVLGGFQANKIGDSDITVVPRAGLIWNPADRITLKALYGEAFRAPYINELHIDHPGLRGNPNLQPEYVSSFNLEARYHDDTREVGINYFYNAQRQNVVEILSPGDARPHVENAGEANIQGVEVDGKYYVTKCVFLTGSLLYQASNDGHGQKDITHVADFGAKAGISYKGKCGLLSLFDVYQGDVADRLHGTLNPQPGPYHLIYLHGRLNLNEVFHLKARPEIALIAQIDNLLDDQLWVPALGSPATETVPFDRGRVVYLGIKVGF